MLRIHDGKGGSVMSEDMDYASEVTEDTLKGKFLTFSLGAEVYGIEIRYVTEIIGLQVITEVPDLAEYVKGIINLRGKIIPVIDVRRRFGKPCIEYTDRTCVIVVDIRENAVGLIVDTVAEVLTIAEQEIVPPPNLNNNNQQRFISAIGKVANEVILILDCDRLLSDDEALSLEGIA